MTTTATESRTTESDERTGVADPWELVIVPARQGLEAVDILRRRTTGSLPAGGGEGGQPGRVGPVLHDDTGDSLGFLVPAGTADGWDHPGSSCTRTDGRGMVLGTEPPVAGAGWLVPPRTDGPVTDPVVLRAALGEAARTLRAADGL